VCQEQGTRSRASRLKEALRPLVGEELREYHIKPKNKKADKRETREPNEETLFQAENESG